MVSSWTNEQLLGELQRVLRHLYDPASLRKSPLVAIFDISPQADIPLVLRRTLTDAIQSLKPGEKASRDSSAWRMYQVLSYRYIEQSSQKEVATDLALSIRQLRRLEGAAIRALADLIVAQYLAQKIPKNAPGPINKTGADQMPAGNQVFAEIATGREHELEWLRKSSPRETVEVIELVETALKTVDPLLSVLKVQVETAFQENLPLIMGKLTTFRQALLNVLATAARSVPGGKVHVKVETKADRILIDVVSLDVTKDAGLNGAVEALGLAKQLVELSSGVLEMVPIQAGQVLAVRLSLPMTKQVPVLFIDDNEDALLLFQRYLSGSRYQFFGTSDPEMALALVEDCLPTIILLDVMMPMIDGWELLGRLRNHPRLNNVPVIVCTILPQEQLALALGAADLIRKPVIRETLLAALDRQMGAAETESH